MNKFNWFSGILQKQSLIPYCNKTGLLINLIKFASNPNNENLIPLQYQFHQLLVRQLLLLM